MELNKKQVGALLKVIGKDTSRAILTNAHIDRYDDSYVLVATDGYVLVALKLGDDAEMLMGKNIRRSAIEKWYKLADGKSRLNTEELRHVSGSDYADNGSYDESEYPKWQNILPSGDAMGLDELTFNAEYAKNLQDLDGGEGLTYKLHGVLKAMVASNDSGTYVLMPKRK